MARRDEIPLRSLAFDGTSIEAQSLAPSYDGLLRRWREINVPIFEQSLKDQIEDPDDRKSFAQAYRRFENRPIHEILENMIWYYRVSASETGQPLSIVYPENFIEDLDTRKPDRISRGSLLDHNVRIEENVRTEKSKSAFGAFLQELSEVIGSSPDGCLELCVITAHEPLPHNAFSFLQKLQWLITGDLDRLHEMPKLAVLYALKIHWPISDDTIRDILNSQAIEQPIKQTSILPSKIRSRNSDDIFNANGFLRSCMTLKWYSICEEYKGDLDTYVWQTYTQPPNSDYLRLYMSGENGRYQRIMINFKTQRLSHHFADLFFSNRDDRSSFTLSNDKNAAYELTEIVTCLFQLVVESSESFVLGLKDQVEKLTYEGRKRPSGSKIQFLLRLEDCRLDALSCLNDCALLIADFKKFLIGDSILEAVLQSRIQADLNVCENNLGALISNLEISKSSIEKTRKMIDQQLNLVQIRRQSVFAILAAVYLPLQYVSGLFGMNLTNGSQNSPIADYTPLASNASLDSTTLIYEQFQNLITELSSSGPYTWDFEWYWVILFPLLMGSIVLPFLAGPITRYIYQSIARNRSYWRVISFFLIPIYIICIYGVLWNFIDGYRSGKGGGLYPPFSEDGYINWEYNWISIYGYQAPNSTGQFNQTNGDHFELDYYGYFNLYYSSADPTFIAYIFYLILTAGTYYSIACYKLYCSIRSKSNRIIWVLFSFATVALSVTRIRFYNKGILKFGTYNGLTQYSWRAANLSLSDSDQDTIDWLNDRANYFRDNYPQPLFTIDFIGA
ncbi:hypothetical protein BP6252_14111 [Coleophoma cylindrospora]|uniref:Uncharacterized protein n=1 Tax=Coleophoma cylindrospora TaxID=1849047 RepID=A0A3D8Q4C9_9HELO|nr:hypothetical protein BP6252_14111 [Coleophoma cylindrospora]